MGKAVGWSFKPTRSDDQNGEIITIQQRCLPEFHVRRGLKRREFVGYRQLERTS